MWLWGHCAIHLRLARTATLGCRTGEPLVDEATGTTIPTGTDVQILLHALHTHPGYWGDDAADWNPDR